jgi:hypothetical protein
MHTCPRAQVFKIVMTPGSRPPSPALSTLVSLSNSAGARVSEAVGQDEQDVKASAARGAGRGKVKSSGKVKSKKSAHGQGGDAKQEEQQGGKEGGRAEQVGQPSPPNALRWLADDALDSAALPTVGWPHVHARSLLWCRTKGPCVRPDRLLLYCMADA